MTPITNSNGHTGTNQAKMKNKTKTARRFMVAEQAFAFVRW
jgi:hypothetical protein